MYPLPSNDAQFGALAIQSSGPHHSATAASAMKLTAAQLDLALRRMVFLDLPLETGSLNSPPGV